MALSGASRNMVKPIQKMTAQIPFFHVYGFSVHRISLGKQFDVFWQISGRDGNAVTLLRTPRSCPLADCRGVTITDLLASKRRTDWNSAQSTAYVFRNLSVKQRIAGTS
jgi:hypothetical protein